jgi:hypothetical protein
MGSLPIAGRRINVTCMITSTGQDEQQVGRLSFATSVAVKMKMTSAISYRC